MGEQLKALVVPTDLARPPEPEELIAFCRQHLAGYKCPKTIEFVATLPRSGIGKLDKKALRAKYLAKRAAVS